jgi:hypothetical protein
MEKKKPIHTVLLQLPSGAHDLPHKTTKCGLDLLFRIPP